MKINIFFLLYAAVLLLAQKLIFADAVYMVKNEFPIMIFIYPLVVLSLPFVFDRPLSLIVAFTVGLAIDMLNDTLGINAFALVATAYLRNPILNLIQPRQGYKLNDNSLRKYGVTWVLLYLSTLLTIHCFSFFMIDAFTFVYFKRVLVSTFLSVLASIPFGFFILMLIKAK